MSGGCRQMREEIVAAGRADLPPDVAAHADGCESCRTLRAEVVVIAEAAIDGELLPPTAAAAMAREALAREKTRRSLFWVFPMLSASASVAALILYFGFAGALVTSEGENPRPLESPSGVVSPQSPVLPSVGTPQLPDSLRAMSELVGGLPGGGGES